MWMMPLDPASVLQDIDDALQEFNSARQRSKYNDLSDLDDTQRFAVAARLISTSLRFAPGGSHHLTQTLAFQQQSLGNPTPALRGMPGILAALRTDIAKGRLSTVTELIHADVFSDFLEMAQYLLDDGGFKDAAAVIAGSSLEAHLRALCEKHGIPTKDGSNKPKKSDTLNHELDKSGAYGSKLDLKNVTAWLGFAKRRCPRRLREVPGCPGWALDRQRARLHDPLPRVVGLARVGTATRSQGGIGTPARAQSASSIAFQAAYCG